MLTTNLKIGPQRGAALDMFTVFILRKCPSFRDGTCSDFICLPLSLQVCFLNPLSMKVCYSQSAIVPLREKNLKVQHKVRRS